MGAREDQVEGQPRRGKATNCCRRYRSPWINVHIDQSNAEMFDDDEARRQIKDLSIQVNERLDTVSKAQFELVNQIQALREENARLRGQVETLEYELDSTKRQQDFYIDLDNRLAQAWTTL